MISSHPVTTHTYIDDLSSLSAIINNLFHVRSRVEEVSYKVMLAMYLHYKTLFQTLESVLER